MDISDFLRLARQYACYGDVGMDAIDSFVQEDTEGMPEKNIESARRFIKRLTRAGVETYGVEEF